MVWFLQNQGTPVQDTPKAPAQDSTIHQQHVISSQSSSSSSKATQGKHTLDAKKSVTPLGADRYEEIITVSRNRREGSQVSSET